MTQNEQKWAAAAAKVTGSRRGLLKKVLNEKSREVERDWRLRRTQVLAKKLQSE